MSIDRGVGSTTPGSTRLVLGGKCAGIAAASVFVLLAPQHGEVLSIPAGLLAGVAGVFAAHRTRGTAGVSWLLLSMLPFLHAIADALWLLNAHADGTPPILSVADALYVLALPPAVAGLLLYPVLRQLAAQWSAMLLDAVVLVLAVTSVSHTVALSEVMSAADSWGSGMILAVYPLTDGLLVALCLLLLLRSAGHVRLDVALLGAAYAVYLASDIAYALTMIRGSIDDNPWLILGYVIAPLLLAAAALTAAGAPSSSVTARRPLTGVLAPSIPVLASIGALGLAFVASPRDEASYVLIVLLLAATGVRQLVQTSAGQTLRLELERRVAARSREVEEVTEEYRRLEAMKSGFVSSVSHELRTPLTAIRAGLEFLAEGDAADHLPPEERSMIDVATRATERLTRLVNDVIDLELLENHAFGLDVAVTDVATILTEASHSLAPLARRRGVEIMVHAPPTAALCDRDRTVQVLVNLIGNALKYAPDSSAVVVRAAQAHDEVVVSVADVGRGIPDDEIEAIFDRFHQVSTGGARPGGTGLGLAISRGIVEAQYGRIWAESTRGAGSTFFFTLPAATETPAHDPVDPAEGAELRMRL